MPEEKTLEGGETIEVFTPEEIEQQKVDAIEKYKEENPDKADEVQKLKDELETTKKSLDGAKDKDENVSTLKEGYEKRIETLEKSIDEKVSTAKSEIIEGTMTDYYTEQIKKIAGDDEEYKKELEESYNELKAIPTTKEGMLKKINNARAMIDGKQEPSNTEAFSSGAGGSTPKVKEGGLTDDDKVMLRKMGKGHLVDKKVDNK